MFLYEGDVTLEVARGWNSSRCESRRVFDQAGNSLEIDPLDKVGKENVPMEGTLGVIRSGVTRLYEGDGYYLKYNPSDSSWYYGMGPNGSDVSSDVSSIYGDPFFTSDFTTQAGTLDSSFDPMRETSISLDQLKNTKDSHGFWISKYPVLGVQTSYSYSYAVKSRCERKWDFGILELVTRGLYRK